jgi:site-specific DNA-methyltransferase (adenine-specific)
MMQACIIGNQAMWLGDCLDMMRHIPAGSVDMVLCDLPYGTTACAWDQVIPFEPLWREYWRVCKPNAAVVLTASQPFTSALVMSQPEAFKVEWIWRKNAGSNFAAVKFVPMKEHESICVFGKGRTVYNPIMQQRAESGFARQKTPVKSNTKAGQTNDVYGVGKSVSKMIGTERVPSSVQDFKRERGLHPTQKPVALFEYLIKTYTNPGELVLDNCSGSGTTAVAAQATGRRSICIERDPGYYYQSVGRMLGAVQ